MVDVKELLPCFLFKQFTTQMNGLNIAKEMSKSYYRVSFLSNSQHKSNHFAKIRDVKELLPCFLFKQFTTRTGLYSRKTGCQRAITVFPF